MKKTSNLFLLACTFTSVSFAQTQDISERNSQSGFSEMIFISEKTGTSLHSNPILTNNINSKALRDFMSSYKNPTDVRWTLLEDGSRVHFYSDGIQTRIFYNNRGGREIMIRYYSEDKLPSPIRHVVKSSYYDFSIFYVTEVSKGDKIVYLVKIEDKTWCKTLMIADGEMEVTEQYVKK